ncbi:MAG: hypothetical protein K9G11_03875 [Rickettsiaceae bacterium]|nr:hypothetical protein [Rickettsiaceae bacterium]
MKTNNYETRQVLPAQDFLIKRIDIYHRDLNSKGSPLFVTEIYSKLKLLPKFHIESKKWKPINEKIKSAIKKLIDELFNKISIQDYDYATKNNTFKQLIADFNKEIVDINKEIESFSTDLSNNLFPGYKKEIFEKLKINNSFDTSKDLEKRLDIDIRKLLNTIKIRGDAISNSSNNLYGWDMPPTIEESLLEEYREVGKEMDELAMSKGLCYGLSVLWMWKKRQEDIGNNNTKNNPIDDMYEVVENLIKPPCPIKEQEHNKISAFIYYLSALQRSDEIVKELELPWILKDKDKGIFSGAIKQNMYLVDPTNNIAKPLIKKVLSEKGFYEFDLTAHNLECIIKPGLLTKIRTKTIQDYEEGYHAMGCYMNKNSEIFFYDPNDGKELTFKNVQDLAAYLSKDLVHEYAKNNMEIFPKNKFDSTICIVSPNRYKANKIEELYNKIQSNVFSSFSDESENLSFASQLEELCLEELNASIERITNREDLNNKILQDREFLKKLDSTFSEMPREEVLDFLVIEGKKLGLCMDKTNPDSSYTNYLRDILYFIYKVGANQETYVTLSDETRFLKDEDSRTNFFAAVADKLKQNDKLESIRFGLDEKSTKKQYDLLKKPLQAINSLEFVYFHLRPSEELSKILKSSGIDVATAGLDEKYTIVTESKMNSANYCQAILVKQDNNDLDSAVLFKDTYEDVDVVNLSGVLEKAAN